MSIKERCREVFKRFTYIVSRKRLVNLYKRSGIRFTRAKQQYKNVDNTVAWRLDDRIDFAKRLATLLDRKAPIIMLDESSVNLWMK